ncbi:unnamed protein product, partial [Rotaria sp. Silwood1]
MSETDELILPGNSRLLVQDSDDSKASGPIIDYAQEPLLSLHEACAPLIHIIHNLLTYVLLALEATSENPPDGLTRDESASIRLYTMEWPSGHKSLYSILNKTLNAADREDLRPW